MKIPKNSNCLLYLAAVIACTLIVTGVFFFSSDIFTEWRWRQEALKHPDKYSKCIGRCQKIKPHKIMMDLPEGWKCDEDYYKERYN